MHFVSDAFPKGTPNKGEPTRKHRVWPVIHCTIGKRTAIDSSAEESLFFAHGSMCIRYIFHVHL